MKLELVFNVRPDISQQVLWISIFIKESKLIEIDILEQRLARMNLGLVILSFHENGQEALGGLETEDRG